MSNKYCPKMNSMQYLITKEYFHVSETLYLLSPDDKQRAAQIWEYFINFKYVNTAGENVMILEVHHRKYRLLSFQNLMFEHGYWIALKTLVKPNRTLINLGFQENSRIQKIKIDFLESVTQNDTQLQTYVYFFNF